MPSSPLLFVVCLLSCCAGTIATAAPKPAGKVNPNLKNGVLWVPCSPDAGQAGDCWQSLAKAVRENPTVNYFSVNGAIGGSPFAVANSEMATRTDYKWFYNKKAGTIDYKETMWIPPDDWGFVNTIKRYEGLTPIMLADFAKQHPGKTWDKVFDDFCDRNGVYVLSFPNERQRAKSKATTK